MTRLIFIFLPCILINCRSSNTNTVSDTVLSSKEELVTEDCYYPRKTILSLDNYPGIITKIASTYIIKTDRHQLEPCSLPEGYKKEGLTVIITGDKLEIFPYERRQSTPFRLKYIKVSE